MIREQTNLFTLYLKNSDELETVRTVEPNTEHNNTTLD